MRIDDILSTNVDEAWYVAHYPNVISDNTSPSDHYIRYGRDAGLYPNGFVASLMEISAKVDRNWYTSEYADVRESGLDPYFHYALYGRVEGRHPNATVKNLERSRKARLISDLDAFDDQFYVLKYKDVAESGMRPLEHYLRYGRQEGRAPNAEALFQAISKQFRPFIALLYRALVGREAQNHELVAWTERQTAGSSHYEVARAIAESDEARVYAHRVRTAFASLRS